MSSHLRAPLVALALGLLFTLATLPAATPFMSVGEVKPGMEGIGRTVFSGETPEEFKVHILGVLRNVVGPQRDLILARLEGGPLEKTGVMQGMSGSPVYVDGRLVGAVSYSLGAFPKEPIAGITPIGEMIEATARPTPRAAATRVRLELPITPERLATALTATARHMRPFAADPSGLEVLGLPRQTGAQLALQLTPIATPIVMSGFSGPSAALLESALRGSGFAPLAGMPSDAQAAPTDASLAPGDAVGVILAGGDLEMGASGTVTHVDGGRVYAFGHPFFNLGPTSFPMTRATVYSLLPSFMTSQKIAALGAVVGTVDQDRATAIAGSLGQGPSLIPIRVHLRSARGDDRRFEFGVVQDEFFTPLLTYLAVANALGGYERQIGTATFAVEGTTRLAGHGAIGFADVFTGGSAAISASSSVAGPVTVVMANDIERVRVESIDVTITASEQPLSAAIERVWLDDTRPRAGRTVPLTVLVREYGGAERIYAVPVSIPPNAPRSLTVLVADAAYMARWDQRELQAGQRPQSIAQIIDTLNRQRRNNQIYVRLLADNAGAVVAGQPMPALPPSVLSVLEADREGGTFARLRQAVLGAWDITTDRAVTGSRTLGVTIEPGRP